MSDKEPPNPFEEIKKQLGELFKNSSVKIHSIEESDDEFDDDDEFDTDDPIEPDESSEILEKIKQFDLKPKEVRDYLNRFVIRQDDAKKVLSVAIRM